jgi:predicted RNase H-like nuclease (RuvC/YqgF family)
MVVASVEFLIHIIQVLVGYYISHRCEKDQVLVSYYTRARKDIEDEAVARDVVNKSYLEVCSKMKEVLQMRIDNSKKVDELSTLSEKLHAELAESRNELAVLKKDVEKVLKASLVEDSGDCTDVDASSKPKRDVSPSSSICSAGLTE